jgi:pumilio RNA-binding family
MCNLAFDASGCRIIQEVLDGDDVVSDLECLVAEMRGYVHDAVMSPHANFVIQKMIETLPASLASFIADELRGVAPEVARHRYGCRIMCRLVEHQDFRSNNTSTSALIDELLVDVQKLCLHSFGRHVVDSLLEHGTSEQRHRVADALRDSVVSYARKRSASYTVENALRFCTARDKDALAKELLADPERFVELAAHDAGSHVVQALLRIDTMGQGNEYVERAKRILQERTDWLKASKYGQRLIAELH